MSLQKPTCKEFTFLNGIRKYTQMSVREGLNSAIKEEMERDKRVFLMGEEVGEYNGAYKVSKGLLTHFGPKRIIDTPISEAGFTGIAVGAAMSGLKPICEFMTFNFSFQAVDQIVNSAAKTRYMSGGYHSVPIVFRGPNGAASGVAAQHSHCLASIYGTIPGLKVVSPYSTEDARGLLKASIRDPNPVVFLENELLYGRSFPVKKNVLDENFTLELGKAKIEKEGNDITLVGYSMGVDICLKASDILKKHNLSCEVINLRSIRPLDIETIKKSVKKTQRLITVEEGFPMFGVGSEICAQISETTSGVQMKRITGADVPLPYTKTLEQKALPKAEDVVKVALALKK